MKNRFLNVTAPPVGAPEGLSEWFYSLQATLNDFIMINEQSGTANITADGKRTSLLNFVDPNGCLVVTPDEQKVTLDFSGLTPVVPVPPACPNCANPPRTVTVVVTGATDPNCDGAWVVPWSGDEFVCRWQGGIKPSVYWIAGQWNVMFPEALGCECETVFITTANCNTGGSAAGCGGTVTVTPNP